jgi:hypothetical protein
LRVCARGSPSQLVPSQKPPTLLDPLDTRPSSPKQFPLGHCLPESEDWIACVWRRRAREGGAGIDSFERLRETWRERQPRPTGAGRVRGEKEGKGESQPRPKGQVVSCCRCAWCMVCVVWSVVCRRRPRTPPRSCVDDLPHPSGPHPAVSECQSAEGR